MGTPLKLSRTKSTANLNEKENEKESLERTKSSSHLNRSMHTMESNDKEDNLIERLNFSLQTENKQLKEQLRRAEDVNTGLASECDMLQFRLQSYKKEISNIEKMKHDVELMNNKLIVTDKELSEQKTKSRFFKKEKKQLKKEISVVEETVMKKEKEVLDLQNTLIANMEHERNEDRITKELQEELEEKTDEAQNLLEKVATLLEQNQSLQMSVNVQETNTEYEKTIQDQEDTIENLQNNLESYSSKLNQALEAQNKIFDWRLNIQKQLKEICLKLECSTNDISNHFDIKTSKPFHCLSDIGLNEHTHSEGNPALFFDKMDPIIKVISALENQVNHLETIVISYKRKHSNVSKLSNHQLTLSSELSSDMEQKEATVQQETPEPEHSSDRFNRQNSTINVDKEPLKYNESKRGSLRRGSLQRSIAFDHYIHGNEKREASPRITNNQHPFKKNSVLERKSILEILKPKIGIDSFPSFTESFLDNLELSENGERLRIEITNNDGIETKFDALSSAFQTDRDTLQNRMEVQKSQSDETEISIEEEIIHLKNDAARFILRIKDSDTRDIYERLLKQVKVLQQSSERVASTAEVYSAVKQEEKIAKPTDVILMHVDNLRGIYEEEHKELEDTEKLLALNKLFVERKSEGNQRVAIKSRHQSFEGTETNMAEVNNIVQDINRQRPRKFGVSNGGSICIGDICIEGILETTQDETEKTLNTIDEQVFLNTDTINNIELGLINEAEDFSEIIEEESDTCTAPLEEKNPTVNENMQRNKFTISWLTEIELPLEWQQMEFGDMMTILNSLRQYVAVFLILGAAAVVVTTFIR